MQGADVVVTERDINLKQLVYTVWICWKAVTVEKPIKEEMNG